jgi:hypothetical protein
MTGMKVPYRPGRTVGIVALRVVVVVFAAAAFGGWAGPLAIDAHDNLLFWVGLACFAAAGLILILGGLWIAASVRALLGDRILRL